MVGRRPIAKVAREAKLPRDAIRNILAGRDPGLSRAAEVAEALGFDFFIGPPKTAGGGRELARKLDPGSTPEELEQAIRELDRLRSLATGFLQSRERERQETADREDAKGLRRELQAAMGGLKEFGDRVLLKPPFATKVELSIDEPRFHEVPGKWQIHEKLAPSWASRGGLILVKAEDDSMAEGIEAGDLVLVDRSQKIPLERRMFLVACSAGIVIRRIVRIGPGLGLRADSPDSVDHCPQWLDPGTITLLGQVAWYGAEGSLHSRWQSGANELATEP